jgi:integrase
MIVAQPKSKNIGYTMCSELQKKINYGTSKREVKQKNGGKSPFIHSYQTTKTYMKRTRAYGDWLRDNGMNKCSMEQARAKVPEYIASLSSSEQSAWTVSTARSALAKVFGCKADDLCKIEKRESSNISRGRELTARTEAIERNHPMLAEAARSIGARHSELAAIKPEDFSADSNGNLSVTIKGKGGRVRTAMVMPGKGADHIKTLLQSTKKGTKMFKIPSGSNVHRWRADYAARCYEYAKAHGMANGQTYSPRGEEETYDTGCLAFVNENLGHGAHRHETAVKNYLSYGDAMR